MASAWALATKRPSVQGGDTGLQSNTWMMTTTSFLRKTMAKLYSSPTFWKVGMFIFLDRPLLKKGAGIKAA